MILVKGGKYYIENGSLLIVVNKIRYRDPQFRYCKVNMTILNRDETLEYEVIKNQKLWSDKISHWILLDGEL